MRTQREKTIRCMNLHLCAVWECDDDGWPIIEPSYAIPERLATFEVASSERNADAFCHFFIDDYRFERVWNKPERYVSIIKRYAGVVAPDFSTYLDMPYPMQQWNVYRSRALAQYWQSQGIEVIPSLNWSDERSLEFCTKGLPRGGVFAVGTAGVLNTESDRERFAGMLARICAEVHPDALLMHGRERELGIDPRIRVVWYANDNHERVVGNAGHRNSGRKKARLLLTQE